MELLQRDLQRQLLTGLSEIYPRSADLNRSFKDIDQRQLVYNLHYLQEHGLINLVSTKMMDGSVHIHFAGITAAGIDFISDDGGLSAILGVVTVKLHEDTIKELLIRRVQASDTDETTKKRLVDKIKSLPASALEHVSMEAMQKGIDSLPNAIEWLATLI